MHINILSFHRHTVYIKKHMTIQKMVTIQNIIITTPSTLSIPGDGLKRQRRVSESQSIIMKETGLFPSTFRLHIACDVIK